MKKSFIVIGLGRFGAKVATTLEQIGSDVLAIDINEESVTEVSKYLPQCVIADATKFDVLKSLGAGSIDHAVVAIGNNLQSSILTVINLKKLGVKKITVRVDEPSHKEVLTLIGATDVVLPEEECAVSLANEIISDSILDYYPMSADFAIVKIKIGMKFKPSTLEELNIRNKFDVNIVGIINSKNEFYIPRGTDVLQPGDIIALIGKKPQIRRFNDFLNS